MKKLIFFLLLSLTVLSAAARDRDTTICPGDTLRLTAYATGAVSYNWYRNNEYLEGQNSNVLVVTASGAYYSEAVGQYGCVSKPSPKVFVEQKMPYALADSAKVAPNRLVTIPILQNDIPGCVSFDHAALSILSQPQKGSASVNEDLTVTYKAIPFATGTDSFTYQLTDQRGFATNIATVYITIDLDCAAVFPNPVNDKLSVRINNRYVSELRILEATGKQLYSTSVLHRPDLTIDMAKYTDGMYIIQLLDAYQNIYCTYKIIKKAR